MIRSIHTPSAENQPRAFQNIFFIVVDAYKSTIENNHEHSQRIVQCYLNKAHYKHVTCTVKIKLQDIPLHHIKPC